jgi:hypothetical protein
LYTGEPRHARLLHRFIPVSEHGKVDALIELLLAEPGLALVFVRIKLVFTSKGRRAGMQHHRPRRRF